MGTTVPFAEDVDQATTSSQDDSLRADLARIVQDCIKYVDEELSPERAVATDYYKGRPFGDEQPGHSAVVLTPVRDTIRGLLPSMLRLIFAPDRVVQFVPKTARDVASAEQATELVQHVFEEENDGFLQTLSVIKDGLLKKLGIFKWGWEVVKEAKTYHMPGLSDAEVELLSQEATIISVDEEPTPGGSVRRFSVEYQYKRGSGKPKVWAVPPEEFLFDRGARSLEDAQFVGHRLEKTRSELLAMGISEEDIEEYGQRDTALDSNAEEIARQTNPQAGLTPSVGAAEAADKYSLIDGYPYMDVDGSGTQELRHVWLLGPGFHIVKNEPCAARPFAVFTPDPEPHTLVGDSLADLTMDIQKTQSTIMRSALDSLALSLYPRVKYVEGRANIRDILNTEIGAPIRTKDITAVDTLQHRWVGDAALGAISAFDDIVERRTGQSRGATDLDADALQSSTKEGVQAAISGSQAQQELYVRIFAETTMKPLFWGIYQMLLEHQDELPEMAIRVNGTWTPVDPAVFNAKLGMTCTVALGTSFLDQRVQTFMAIAADQRGILEAYGLSNPLVTLDQYRATLAKLMKLRGIPDADTYYQQVPPGFRPPAPPPAPTPEQIQADAALKIEQMQDATKRETTTATLALQQEQAVLEHKRAVANDAATLALKRIELGLKYGTKVSEAELDANIQREKMVLDAATKAQTAGGKNG